MEKKEDRRVRKTKKQLADALAELLEKKPLKNITVSEITAAADVNRGTFYLHYRDIYDMADKIQQEILTRFNEIVSDNAAMLSPDALYPMLTEIYRLLEDNARLARCLLIRGGDSSFIDTLKNIIRSRFFSDLKETKIRDKEKFAYFYRFTVSGCMGIFEGWLEDGMQESAEDMARLTERLVLGCFSAVSPAQ